MMPRTTRTSQRNIGLCASFALGGGPRAIWMALDRITEPFYRPIRRIMPDFGALDLSPLVVLLIIWCLQIAIGRLALWWVGAGAL